MSAKMHGTELSGVKAVPCDFGKDKVFMDFAFFAVAFNIKKMCAKMAKEGIDWLIKRFYELTVAIFRCCEHISKYCSLKKGHSLNITKSAN